MPARTGRFPPTVSGGGATPSTWPCWFGRDSQAGTSRSSHRGAVAGDRTVPVEQAFAESLGRVPESAAEARHLVAAALKAWSLPQLVEDAELVMTELVSNAVAHTAGECIRVNVLRLSDRRVRISVADRDRKRPTRREPDVCGERGRGLLLVEACSSKWGVRVLPGGKAVWSELEAAP